MFLQKLRNKVGRENSSKSETSDEKEDNRFDFSSGQQSSAQETDRQSAGQRDKRAEELGSKAEAFVKQAEQREEEKEKPR